MLKFIESRHILIEEYFESIDILMKTVAFIFLFLQMSLEWTHVLSLSFRFFVLEMIDILCFFLLLEILMLIVVVQTKFVPDVFQKILLISVQSHYLHLKGQLFLILLGKLVSLLFALVDCMLEVYLWWLFVLFYWFFGLADAGMFFSRYMYAFNLCDLFGFWNFWKSIDFVVLGDCSCSGLIGSQLD